MALDSFAPQFFSQDFAVQEMFEFPYLMFATDRSGMVPAGGDRVTWPDVEGTMVTQDYTPGSNLTDRELQDAAYTLNVNQRKAISVVVDDVERTQKMPAIMAEMMTQSVRELMWAMNAYLRAQFESTTRLAASGLTQPMRGDHDGLTSNQTNFEILHTGGSGGAHPMWGTEAFRQQLIAMMDEEAGGFAKRHGWVSQNADTKGVAICEIQIANEFRRYLTDDKPNLGAGAIVDSAFGLGRILKIAGWEIMEDVTRAPFLTNAAIASAGPRINFVHPQRRSLYYARQLQSLETERVQSRFANRLKGLYLYGAEQGASRHLYSIQLLLSNS